MVWRGGGDYGASMVWSDLPSGASAPGVGGEARQHAPHQPKGGGALLGSGQLRHGCGQALLKRHLTPSC